MLPPQVSAATFTFASFNHELIVGQDQQTLFVPAWVVAEDKNLSDDTIVKMIEETVDAHVDAKVDVLVQCVFARF